MAVGDTVDVVYDEVPEGVCTYRTYDYDGGDEVSDVIEVNDKGQLIPKKSRCCRCESVHRGKPELYCDGVQNRNVTHLQ
ncbi:MAG: hypothetical protein ACLTDT_07540 [Clostridium sp.]